MPTRTFYWQGLNVTVDLRPQVLRLDMDPFASWQEVRKWAVGRRSGGGEIGVITYERGEPFGGGLYPRIAAIPDEGPFVSAAVLAQKAKCVDDGIVAAVELIVAEGTADLLGRATILHELQDVTRGEWDRSPRDAVRAEAIGLISAARSLAGDEEPAGSSTWPTALRLHRNRSLRDFRSDHATDVPLGIYSWNGRLTGLYRQGKALQRPLEGKVASVLARALKDDEPLRAAYEAHVALSALTNQLAGPHLLTDRGDLDRDGPRPAIFPASESPEGRLVKRLVGTDPVPPGFDLIDELIARVGDGRLSLATTQESGWYDHVLHALEPLLMPDRAPEAAKLRLAEDYRADLRELFRALLGAARESHVKQVETPVGGGCPLVVSPHLTFEPLAEHYRRRAASYRFVRERLVGLLGEDVLLSRNRLTPRGEAGVPLLDELVTMEQLFTGAWAVVLGELGIDPEVNEADRRWVLSAKAAARSWASSHRSDPDLAEDVRMMVPLFKDNDPTQG
jgi:hypothetical protein